MAQAKYKIGQLAKIKDDAEGTFIFGEVTGIVTQEKGYSYQLENARITVGESEIIEVYVPLKKSAKKSSTKKSSKRTTKALGERSAVTQ